MHIGRRTIGYITLTIILIFTAIPFNGFRRPEIDWDAPWHDIFANILLYAPLGYGFGDLGPLRIVTRAGALSLAIETAQMFYQDRYSQPSDVISNIIGAALGVYLYRWMKKAGIIGTKL